MTLPAERYREALILNGRAFAAAIAQDRHAAISACPGWDATELLWHLTEVHWFWGEIVEQRVQEPTDALHDARPPRPQNHDDLALLYDRNFERLLSALDDAPDDAEVWSWAPQHDVAFVRRRMAQETAVHRWDAEAATGTPAPIDADLAEDGIAEFLTFFVDVQEQPGISLEVAESGRRYDLGAGATMRGSASDLLLVLWRRVPPVGVEVDDPAALDRFLTRLDLE